MTSAAMLADADDETLRILAAHWAEISRRNYFRRRTVLWLYCGTPMISLLGWWATTASVGFWLFLLSETLIAAAWWYGSRRLKRQLGEAAAAALAPDHLDRLVQAYDWMHERNSRSRSQSELRSALGPDPQLTTLRDRVEAHKPTAAATSSTAESGT